MINGMSPNRENISSNIEQAEVSRQTPETTIVIAGKEGSTKVESTVEDEQLEKKINDALRFANGKMQQNQIKTRCEFTFFDNVNRVSIKLIDKETNEVVKEIPPEKTIKMIEKLWEVAGLMVDERL